MSFLLAPLEGGALALLHFARANEVAAIVGFVGFAAGVSTAVVWAGASLSGVLVPTDTEGRRQDGTHSELKKNEAAAAQHWATWGEAALAEVRARREAPMA